MSRRRSDATACGWLRPSWQASEVFFSSGDVEEVLGAPVAEPAVAEGAEATIRIVVGAAVALQVGREALTGDSDALTGPPLRSERLNASPTPLADDLAQRRRDGVHQPPRHRRWLGATD